MLARWSERRQMGVVLAFSVLGAVLLWLAALRPAVRRCAELEGEIRNVSLKLAGYGRGPGQPPMWAQLAAARREEGRLLLEWAQASTYLDTFKGERDVLRMRAEDQAPDHIDFKVALFDARRNLIGRARKHRVALPHDLGIDEAVDSGKDARALMLQLASVEKLGRLLVDLKVPAIEVIEPLPPRVHGTAANGGEFMREYPVRVQMRCRHSDVRALVLAASDSASFFAFRQLRMEKISMEERDLLAVSAVLSALVFGQGLAETEPGTPGAELPK